MCLSFLSDQDPKQIILDSQHGFYTMFTFYLLFYFIFQWVSWVLQCLLPGPWVTTNPRRNPRRIVVSESDPTPNIMLDTRIPLLRILLLPFFAIVQWNFLFFLSIFGRISLQKLNVTMLDCLFNDKITCMISYSAPSTLDNTEYLLLTIWLPMIVISVIFKEIVFLKFLHIYSTIWKKIIC